MTVFNYLSLGVIGGLGLLISIEDCRIKKIRNKWIISGFGIGCLFLLGAFMNGVIDLDYLIKVFVNTGSSFVVSFFIWRLGLWPAGDSKLFVMISFLLPLHYYWKNHLFYFPSMTILVNSFVIFLIFLILKSGYFFLKTCINFLKRKNVKRMIFAEFLNEKKGVLAGFLKDTKKIRKMFFGIITRVLIYIFFFVFLSKGEVRLKTFFGMFLIFLFINALINFYIEKSAKQKIKTDAVTHGLNLTHDTVSIIKENKGFFKNFGVLRAEGLEERQANLIKKFLIKNNIAEIYIYRTIPFSFWIISGTWMTVLFKRTFF